MKSMSFKWRPFVLGVACTAVVGTLVLSGEVRAVAAALVQVVNTMANPVPSRAADNPAFSAWGQRIFPAASGTTITVPADKYLVIDSATGFTNSPSIYHYGISFTNKGVGQAKLLPLESTRKGIWFYTRAEQIHV